MITPVRARVATREYDSARIIRITNNIKHLNQLLSKITDFALIQGKWRVSGNDTFFDLMVPSFWILNLIGLVGPIEDRLGDIEYNCRVSLCKLDRRRLCTGTERQEVLVFDTIRE